MQKLAQINRVSTANRRNFIKTGALAGAAFIAVPGLLRSQDAPKKINIGVIGAGGKGSSDTDAVSGENIVALCDVDGQRLAERLKKYPNAKGFKDYRKMLDEVGKSLEAVVISTPDHHHGLATALAMKMKKHVYTQKPLAQTVYEARILRKLAAETKVVTQMGNQGSSEDGLRRAVEVIQAGVIGPLRELHVWSNRPVWPTQGLDRPAGEDPVPQGLDWDLWLGPAPFRPYKGQIVGGDAKRRNYYYHPFSWRGWFDFGTGALGDMACHTVNMPFRALKLGYPVRIECEDVKMQKAETFPRSSRIRFEFPQREDMVPLKFWWYDGNPAYKDVEPFRPSPDLTKEILEMQAGRLPGSGCLIIGDKGKVFSPDDYGARFYLKLNTDKEYMAGDKHEACANIPQKLPRIHKAHYKEWLEAIRNGGKPYSEFDIAAYLTEIILLGCIALRHGVRKPIDWDGPAAKAKNADVSHLVKRNYRKGWEIPV